MTDTIPFIDLGAQRRRLGPAIDRAIDSVLAHGRYILGPEVADLETALADRIGVRHVITCANGTDAMQLCLRALGTGPGDGVFVPAFTFAATAEVVALVGATPVFVDIDADTFNIDPASLSGAIESVRVAGELNPVGIIPVDLFGHPANYNAITELANRNDLWILEDAAQAFGAKFQGRACGSFGIAGTTSFFPAKPLGCYGDGGAIFSDDDGLAQTLRSLRMHGQGTDKNDNVSIGTNSRLDTIQAAILLEKLRIFDDELVSRDRIAQRYSAAFTQNTVVPMVAEAATSVWAHYTIRTPAHNRIRQALAAAGLPSAIYYPRTLPQQPAYAGFPVAPGGVPAAETAAREVVSLPMHPYLDADTQDRIIAALLQAVGSFSAASS
jgi:dTDP-4-amino-4,6-dideoxygalactose transaminase